MRPLLLLVLAAALQACTAPAKRIGQPDALCVNDCLGAGGTQEFCQSRCSD